MQMDWSEYIVSFEYNFNVMQIVGIQGVFFSSFLLRINFLKGLC